MEALEQSFSKQFSLDMDTLLHPASLYNPRSTRATTSRKVQSHIPSKHHLRKPKGHQAKDNKDSEHRVIVVKGKDIGDLPTKYEVQGLRPHELPTIGTFVHQNILPGFTYVVRKLGSETYLFKKKPLILQNVGCGIGKRITFASKLKNSNNNYFYSDTHPSGYGFSLIAIEPAMTFTVVDSEDRPVGEGIILEVGAQQEEASYVRKNGTIVKKASVTFSCDVKYSSQQHGLMSLLAEEVMELTGTAVITKEKKKRIAYTDSIEVEMPNLGQCSFQMS